MGHLLLDADGLTLEDASALCDVGATFLDGIGADASAVLVGTYSQSEAGSFELIAVRAPGGTCAT